MKHDVRRYQRIQMNISLRDDPLQLSLSGCRRFFEIKIMDVMLSNEILVGRKFQKKHYF